MPKLWADFVGEHANYAVSIKLSQSIFTCSKPTMETTEQYMKPVQN